MSDKYLLLEFENAGWFQDNKGSCDKSFDNIKGNTDRENIGVFKEPITSTHISNMLHVLFGERPVPYHRYSLAKPIDDYIVKANNSYLKIVNYKKDVYPTEKIRLKKSPFNANSSPSMNWYIIEEFIGEEMFGEFLSILESKYDITRKKFTLIDALNIVRCDLTHILCFTEKLEKNKKTALSQYIKNKNICTITNNDNTLKQRVKHTFANGIGDISRISGYIIVPVDDGDLLKLKNCAGTATILDGGLVSIKRVCYDYDISEYRKVSEISIEINEKSYKH